MKKEFVNFICELHGYLIRVKEIHWNTDSDTIHTLCDEFHEELFKLEDEFAEVCMGMEGKKFEIGKLLPLVPNSKDFKQILIEFEQDVIKMKEKTNSAKYGGMDSVLNDMLKLVDKYKYRSTQK